MKRGVSPLRRGKVLSQMLTIAFLKFVENMSKTKELDGSIGCMIAILALFDTIIVAIVGYVCLQFAG